MQIIGGGSMIVYELKNNFVMITQDDHASVSGQMYNQMRSEVSITRRHQSVSKAVREHDRAWKELDDTPIWNDRLQVPYSFIDFPLALKLVCYRNGIDEIENEDPYAALLCSLHYTSLVKNTDHLLAQKFVESEQTRQERIDHLISDSNLSLDVMPNLSILQFFDRLSLLLCYDEEGSDIERQFPWYQSGVADASVFLKKSKNVSLERDHAHFFKVDPFIFKNDFEVSLPMKYVSKRATQELGLAEAYKQTPWYKRTMVIQSPT
jgi:ribosomal protein L25 (general stress protein Ctc)